MDAEKTRTVRKRAPRGQARALLVRAATELFTERGVSGTSLQDIADRLGVTKAAVYHQYASKDEIISAVAEPVIAKLESIASIAEQLDPSEARASVIEGLVDLALVERGAATIMRSDPTMARLLNSSEPYKRQIERIDGLILGPHPTPELRITLAFVGGGILSVGALPGIDGPAELIRATLVAATTRALAV